MKTIIDIYINLGHLRKTGVEINSATDDYRLTASEYFGVPYAEVTDDQRAEIKHAVYMCTYGVRSNSRTI